MIRLLALSLALLVVAGCGASEKPTEPTAPQATPIKTSETAIRSGVYRVSGKSVLDHCDDLLVFAADRVRLDLEAGQMEALFSGSPARSYDLELRGAELIARGNFERLSKCGTHQYVEVWRLRADGDDLEGQLTAYYRDARSHRDCLRACKVVMAVKGTRAGDSP